MLRCLCTRHQNPVVALTQVWQLSKEQFPQGDQKSTNHYYDLCSHPILVYAISKEHLEEIPSHVTQLSMARSRKETRVLEFRKTQELHLLEICVCITVRTMSMCVFCSMCFCSSFTLATPLSQGEADSTVPQCAEPNRHTGSQVCVSACSAYAEGGGLIGGKNRRYLRERSPRIHFKQVREM